MTSKPFAPARIVGGSVLVERKPFYNGGVHHFRGVEIIAEASNEARLPMPRAPYRVPSPAPPPTSRRVEVCEAMLLLGKETASVDAFHEVGPEDWEVLFKSFEELLKAYLKGEGEMETVASG